MHGAYAMMILPWAAVLSAGALLWAWRGYRRHDTGAVVRRVGWAFMVWALWLVGLLSLVVQLAVSVADWGAGFAFRVSSWAGVALGVLSVVLIAAGSWGKKRAKSSRSSLPKAKKAKKAPDQVAGGTSAPAVTDDDMADIQAILNKHGID